MAGAPSVTLKVIFTVHLILTVWASMEFLPRSYIYMNAFMLLFGAMAITMPEANEALLMFFVTNVASILLDVIFLSIYASHTYSHTSQFSLAMAIINLLVRPFSSFVLYRVYQEKNGQYSDFGIPNIPGMPSFGGSPRAAGYENIDQPVPSSTIESATPHSTIDKSPMP